VHFKHASAKI